MTWYDVLNMSRITTFLTEASMRMQMRASPWVLVVFLPFPLLLGLFGDRAVPSVLCELAALGAGSVFTLALAFAGRAIRVRQAERRHSEVRRANGLAAATAAARRVARELMDSTASLSRCTQRQADCARRSATPRAAATTGAGRALAHVSIQPKQEAQRPFVARALRAGTT